MIMRRTLFTTALTQEPVVRGYLTVQYLWHETRVQSQFIVEMTSASDLRRANILDNEQIPPI